MALIEFEKLARHAAHRFGHLGGCLFAAIFLQTIGDCLLQVTPVDGWIRVFSKADILFRVRFFFFLLNPQAVAIFLLVFGFSDCSDPCPSGERKHGVERFQVGLVPNPIEVLGCSGRKDIRNGV